MSKGRVQLLRFAAAGVVGLAVDVALLYACLALGSGYYLGRVLSFLGAAWTTWQINRRYAFADGAPAGSAWRQWWQYFFAMLGGGLINYAVYSAAIALLPAHALLPLAAVAAGSLAGMAFNFAAAKWLVFRA